MCVSLINILRCWLKANPFSLDWRARHKTRNKVTKVISSRRRSNSCPFPRPSTIWQNGQKQKWRQSEADGAPWVLRKWREEDTPVTHPRHIDRQTDRHTCRVSHGARQSPSVTHIIGNTSRPVQHSLFHFLSGRSQIPNKEHNGKGGRVKNHPPQRD